MNGVEGLTISDWLNDRLVADGTLQGLLGGAGGIPDRVSEGTAPVGTGYPVVVFTVGPEGRVVGGVGTVEINATFLVLVKAVTEGESYAPLVPIMSRIHALLQASLNVVTPMGTIMSVVRTTAVQYPEQTEGVEYRHLGGLYEVRVQ